MRENISKNLKSSGKLLYVILNFSNSGLPNDTSILNNKEFSQCLNQIYKGKEIIIRIAGIVLAGFKNESEVFNKTWFETAFDTAFEGELSKEIQDLKAIAAISWANQVNTDIQFKMNLLSAADFFYPTWILTTKQPFWKILLLN